MAKQIIPPDENDKYFGFDMSTQSGRLLYMKYIDQRELERGFLGRRKKIRYDEGEISETDINEEYEKFRRMTPELQAETERESAELMMAVDAHWKSEYKDSVYVVVTSIQFWVAQVFLIALTAGLTLYFVKR